VEVAFERSLGELAVTVRDNGRGLPLGFDVHHSTGMGFSIVRTLVEDDLRGTLSVTSGHGATVSLRVPLPSDP